jgi:cytochrome c oxidase subunit 1
VLIGGAVFPLFGAWYYWFPKITGRMLSERLGRWNFWLFFVGFNVAFYPMHHLGLAGMPRRVYTYQAGLGWDTLNLVSTLGALTIAVSVLLFIVNAVRSLRHGAPAGDDPWGAGTLEWATTSPPPAANFPQPIVVHGRDPQWEGEMPEGAPSHVTGLAADMREVLVTSVIEARPDHRAEFPRPTIWPFLSAIATTVMFIASIFTPWAVVWGSIPIAIALIAWFWPGRKETEEGRAHERRPQVR